jgi:large subunit ribosomal protein L6
MSKIGQKTISIPSGVQVEIKDSIITARGPKGEQTVELPRGITIAREEDVLTVSRVNDSKKNKSAHGLFRNLIFNAISGVEKAWQKKLEIVGTGYNVKMQGQDLALKLGYSHPVVYKTIPGIQFVVEGNNKIVVSGVDKQLVGQVAHQIKILKKPDIYKGKGIRYEGEVVRIKPGKKAKA